ncbi:radical SAM family protein [Planomonospora sphaerica]|uniref:7-carboxy-7-deazaguanine synthase n=1 Tax=Planomonospora sphaerica TaxID=161355 RepID=A0A171DIQ5_9ACTN|nr:radical SAM protein [Planomonospora sphaerica]GAT68769.1 radical SAM family protein [Planomonospora sphaerica]
MSERRFGAQKLIVSEIFGPTFQGEGYSLGRRCGFLRLGHCNLACSWCDTPYTWDWHRFSPESELSRLDVTEVAARIENMAVPLLVISGGEPMLQQAGLVSLFAHLPPGLAVEIETNGTVAPEPAVTERVSRFTVSPKLTHAAMSRQRRIRPAVLHAFAATDKATFKFVAASPYDLDEIETLTRELDLPDVYVMPEGRDPDQLMERMRALAPAVQERSWSLTTRLHVLLWGDRRAV